MDSTSNIIVNCYVFMILLPICLFFDLFFIFQQSENKTFKFNWMLIDQEIENI